MEKERDIKIEKGFPELWRKKEIPRNKRDIQSYGERKRCQDRKEISRSKEILRKREMSRKKEISR